MGRSFIYLVHQQSQVGGNKDNTVQHQGTNILNISNPANQRYRKKHRNLIYKCQIFTLQIYCVQNHSLGLVERLCPEHAYTLYQVLTFHHYVVLFMKIVRLK